MSINVDSLSTELSMDEVVKLRDRIKSTPIIDRQAAERLLRVSLAGAAIQEPARDIWLEMLRDSIMNGSLVLLASDDTLTNAFEAVVTANPNRLDLRVLYGAVLELRLSAAKQRTDALYEALIKEYPTLGKQGVLPLIKESNPTAGKVSVAPPQTAAAKTQPAPKVEAPKADTAPEAPVPSAPPPTTSFAIFPDFSFENLPRRETPRAPALKEAEPAALVPPPPPKAADPTPPAPPAAKPQAPTPKATFPTSAPVMPATPSTARSTDHILAAPPPAPKNTSALSNLGTASEPSEAVIRSIAAGNAIAQVVQLVLYYIARALILPFEVLFRKEIGERYYSPLIIILAVVIPELLFRVSVISQLTAQALVGVAVAGYLLHQGACYRRDRAGGYWHSYAEGTARFRSDGIQSQLAAQNFTFDFAKLVIEPGIIFSMAVASWFLLPGPERPRGTLAYSTLGFKGDPITLYLLMVGIAYLGYNFYCHKVRRKTLLDRLDSEVVAEAMERSTQPHPKPGIFAHKGVSYSVLGKAPPQWTK